MEYVITPWLRAPGATTAVAAGGRAPSMRVLQNDLRGAITQNAHDVDGNTSRLIRTTSTATSSDLQYDRASA
jgi:hypothetical protein